MRTAKFAPYLLAVLAALAGLAGLAVGPATGAPPAKTVDYVVVAGAPGLRWSDLDPDRTPALWRAAQTGSIGWLSVRSAARTTCPEDGWLTFGAGNYAAFDNQRVTGACPADRRPGLSRPDALGANIAAQQRIVRYNQNGQPYGALPGALAESVRCTVAVGPGAALAAARPFGRVDRYEPALGPDAAKLLSSCLLSVIDLGTISGDGEQRARQVAAADAVFAAADAARPDNSLVMVAGLADTDAASRLHVAIVNGPGFQGGWLTSAATGRPGYVQVVDLTATTLAALGRPAPERRFVGKPATVAAGRPDGVAPAVTGGYDADRRAAAQLQVSTPFFTVVAIMDLLVFLLAVPLMVRARRHAGPGGAASPPRKLLNVAEVLLVGTALALPAALLADVVPWWRTDRPGLVFTATTLVLAALGTAAVRLSPHYRRTLWPMGTVAAFSALVVGLDVLTGARLQLNGVAGYSTLQGGRYAGVGGVGLGVFVAGLLLTAAWLAQKLRRGWRPVVVVIVGGFGVVLVGSPYLGADPVGAIAVTAGVCVAAAISTGGWLTFSRFAWASLAGLVVTAGFALLDLRRPEAEQGSLGRFLTALADGTAGPALHRVASSNARALLDSPLTVVAAVGAVMLAFALLSPWGGLQRLFGLHPAVRAAGAGTTVATLLAGALGGSAAQVAGAAVAMAVPLAVLTALRVLDHAADRTRPASEYGAADTRPAAAQAQIADGGSTNGDGATPNGGDGAGKADAGPVQAPGPRV